MTLSDLLAVVYRFYPRGILPTGLGYDDTEERHRQREVARRAVAEYPTWKAMIRRLGARYPLMNHSVRILAADYVERSYDPGYSADIEIGGHTLGFHVSLLGPYYGIRRLGAPDEEQPALDLAREIEATYPGHETIPPELGNEVVPDVGNFGKTTIYHCLLSEVWESSSYPTPPPDTTPWPDEPEPPAGAEGPAPGSDDAERETRIHWWTGGARSGRSEAAGVTSGSDAAPHPASTAPSVHAAALGMPR